MTELQGPVWCCQACYWLRTTGLAWYNGHAREGPHLVGQNLVSYRTSSEGCLCARRFCRPLKESSVLVTECLNCSTLLEQLRCFRCGFLHMLTKRSLWGKYPGKIIKLLLFILTRTKIQTSQPPVQSSDELPASENVTLGAVTWP